MRIFVKKMIEQKLLDQSVLDMMERIAEKYNHLKLVIMKQIMKRRIDHECNNLIQDIINSEYEVYQKMCKHLNIGV